MVKNIPVAEQNYHSLVQSIGDLLNAARKQVYTQVNQVMVQTYWEIGRHIVEYEQGGKEKAEYGNNLLDRLSIDLTVTHGKGFDPSNLRHFRRFYLQFSIWDTLCPKLSWSHYRLIIRHNEPIARNFYMIQTEKEQWSVRELARQMDTSLFERIALSKDKKGVLEMAKEGQKIVAPGDLIKDSYVLEFLDLETAPKYTESQVEQKIMDNLQKFLLELGKGFTFETRQKRITLEDDHFYIDLVFYNYILSCFLIIELKIGKLTHQDLGQLQMYVNYYDRRVRLPHHNPTIGILLCAEKNKAVVEYTLPLDNTQMFAAQYKTYLPDTKVLQQQVEKVLEEN